MKSLAARYADVYKDRIKKDIEKYGKSEAIRLWKEFKENELPLVHTEKFIKMIEDAW